MPDIGLEAQTFILAFIRVLSAIWLLPLFESRSISAAYKAGLSLIIAFSLYQAVSPANFGGDVHLLAIAIAKEVLIGISLGFMVRVIFAMVAAAGELLAMQSGLSFARAMDPVLMANVTVIEQFKSLLSIMVFLSIDGHHMLLKGLSVSFKEIALGSASAKPELFHYVISSVGKLFAASLKICAPVVVTLFLVDIGLGILTRMISQVNVFVEGASMKILITIGMLAVSLNLIVPIIANLFKGMDTEIFKVIRYLG